MAVDLFIIDNIKTTKVREKVFISLKVGLRGHGPDSGWVL